MAARPGSVTTSSTTRLPFRSSIDVSDHYEAKRRALACYRSQFVRAAGDAETRLNSPTFGQLIESRDAQFGALAGVRYAEGVVTTEPIVRTGLLRDGS